MKFDRNANEHLSKFEFANSLNFMSKIVGGVICPRSDLDCIFQLIDINGDETISKKEYMIFMDKFLETMKECEGVEENYERKIMLGYQKLKRFSYSKLEDIETS